MFELFHPFELIELSQENHANVENKQRSMVFRYTHLYKKNPTPSFTLRKCDTTQEKPTLAKFASFNFQVKYYSKGKKQTIQKL